MVEYHVLQLDYQIIFNVEATPYAMTRLIPMEALKNYSAADLKLGICNFWKAPGWVSFTPFGISFRLPVQF